MMARKHRSPSRFLAAVPFRFWRLSIIAKTLHRWNCLVRDCSGDCATAECGKQRQKQKGRELAVRRRVIQYSFLSITITV